MNKSKDSGPLHFLRWRRVNTVRMLIRNGRYLLVNRAITSDEIVARLMFVTR